MEDQYYSFAVMLAVVVVVVAVVVVVVLERCQSIGSLYISNSVISTILLPKSRLQI